MPRSCRFGLGAVGASSSDDDPASPSSGVGADIHPRAQVKSEGRWLQTMEEDVILFLALRAWG